MQHLPEHAGVEVVPQVDQARLSTAGDSQNPPRSARGVCRNGVRTGGTVSTPPRCGETQGAKCANMRRVHRFNASVHAVVAIMDRRCYDFLSSWSHTAQADFWTSSTFECQALTTGSPRYSGPTLPTPLSPAVDPQRLRDPAGQLGHGALSPARTACRHRCCGAGDQAVDVLRLPGTLGSVRSPYPTGCGRRVQVLRYARAAVAAPGPADSA